MNLGFDMDGVICDTATAVIEYINNKHNLNLTSNDITHYWISDITFDSDPKLNKRIVNTMINKFHDIDLQVTAKPCKDAVVVLHKLKKKGNRIHLITNRDLGKDKEKKTALWFKHHNIPFDSLIHCGSKGEKGIVGKSLNLDFYLDDYEGNLESMYLYKNRWRKGLGLLDRSWNKDPIDGSKFIRFNNWESVLRHLGITNR